MLLSRNYYDENRKNSSAVTPFTNVESAGIYISGLSHDVIQSVRR